jgi:hypothetical protein
LPRSRITRSTRRPASVRHRTSSGAGPTSKRSRAARRMSGRVTEQGVPSCA